MLRKLTAILFLIVFYVNVAGYQLLFWWAARQADEQLATRLDQKKYSDEELITLSVPLSMPYQVGLHNYERVDGSIVIEGKTYAYVARKIENGNLYLKCILNQENNRLKSAKNDFFRLSDNFQQEQNDKPGNAKSSITKTNFSDYDDLHLQYAFVVTTAIQRHQESLRIYYPSSGKMHRLDRPPDTYSVYS